MQKWRHLKHVFLGILMFIGVNLNAQDIKMIENVGQWHNNVEYRAEVSGGYLFAEKNAFTFKFYDIKEQMQISRAHIGKGNFPNKLHFHSYKIRFLDSNPNTAILTKDVQKERYNYFLGNDQSRWGKNAKAYGAIYYEDIYQNIDLELYSENSFVKYDMIVHPQGDPGLIKFAYDDVEKIKLKDGSLHIKTSVNNVIEEKPYAYQWVNGTKREVYCEYFLLGNELSFSVGEYDKSLPLIIDPILKFSTFSGSTANNFGYTATYDRFGYLYSGSSILSGLGEYPTTPGAFDTSFNGGSVDFGITKYDSTGTSLVYSTYIGGSESELPHSIVVNDVDEIYILGTTSSSNFPITSDAFQTTFYGGSAVNLNGLAVNYASGTDIFITRLSAQGDDVLSSTFLGGTSNDGLNLADPTTFNYADEIRGEIDLDEDGNVYIATSTFSTNFPVTTDVYQSSNNGNQEGVVAKLSGDLQNLDWSTYYGGGGNDAVYSLAFDDIGQVVICGGTSSGDLEMTPNAYDSSYNGGLVDAFTAKFNADVTNVVSSTYLGTSTYDQAYFVELDSDNNVHLFGQSTSGSEYIFNAGYDDGNSGQFISKFNADMSAFIWSTTFGTGDGAPDISPTAFLVDLCSRIYLSGWGGPVGSGTSSTLGLPVTSDAFQDETTSGDFYLFVIEEDASNLVYASFYGGDISNEHVDGGTSRFDRKGKIYQSVCAGCQGNSDFPIEPANAFSSTNNSGGCNNGVFKFDFDLPGIVADFAYDPACLPDPIQFNNISEGGLTFLWDFGDDTTSGETDPSHLYDAPGVYEVTLIITDPMSCNLADTISQDLIILQEENFELEEYTICNGESVQLGFDPIPSPGYTYTWSPAGGLTNPSISNPTTTVSVSTEFTLTVSNGVCESTSTQNVNVVNFDALFPEDETSCIQGLQQVLTITDFPVSSTFIWSISPDFTNPINGDPNANEITVNPNETETYFVQITFDDCELEESVNVFVEEFEVELPEVIELCVNESENIVAIDPSPSPTVNFLWDTNDAIVTNTNSPSITVSTDENTTLYLTGTSLNGCEANDSIMLNVNIIALEMPLDTIICDETELNLVANTFGTGDTFTWSDEPTFTNVLSSDSSVVLSPEMSSTYYFQTENFCEINGQVQVTIASDLYSISPDIFLCAGDELSLELNAIVPGQTYTVDWSPNDGIISGDGTSLVSVSTDTSQYFYADVTTSEGCEFSDSVLVEVSDLSTFLVNATADETVIPQGGSTVLHAVPEDNFDINWSPSDPLSSAGSSNPTATLFETTTFTLTISDERVNGQCLRGDTITISVFEFDCNQPTIFVPNAFSPNGDGFNDSLLVRSDYIDDMELFIYNRWGELVFETQDQNIGWDGTFKGATASPAVYVYHLNLTCINRQKGLVKGNITLLK
jgi:gliding motility-associated-like protein